MTKLFDTKLWTIGFRIALAFFCIIVFLIIQGGLALYNLQNVTETQRQVLTRQLALMEFREKLAQIRITVFKLLGTTNPEVMEKLSTKVNTSLTELDDESKLLGIQSEMLAQNQETYIQIMNLHWNFETRRAYDLINSTSEQEYETLYQELETMTNTIEAAARETVRRSNAQTMSITLTLSSMSILIAVFWRRFLINTIVIPLNQVVGFARKIAEGDLSMNIEVTRRDETGQLVLAMKNMVEKIQWIVDDVNTLIKAGQNGELSIRADVSRHQGEFARIVQGMNQSLDAIIGPLNVSATYVDCISKGEYPQKITEDYRGDFNRIKHNLNLLIDTTTELKLVNERLQHEIIEHKRAEEEIRILNAELEERVKHRTAELEAVNKELKDFAYVTSHDLKAPLRGISRLAGWLVADYTDAFDKRGKEMTKLLINRVKRMDNLIEGILHYSRIGRIVGEAEPIDLNTLVQEVIEMLTPSEHIQMTIESDLPIIVGDRTRIAQVFQNLLSNAIEFMDKPEGKVMIGCIDEGTHWTFRVVDNGPGIDPKYHEKIFQIFQTLQPRDEHESTGIGLALVKKIIELHGGKIWVDSTPGQGSSFSFTFPKKEKESKT